MNEATLINLINIYKGNQYSNVLTDRSMLLIGKSKISLIMEQLLKLGNKESIKYLKFNIVYN